MERLKISKNNQSLKSEQAIVKIYDLEALEKKLNQA
jgi:hypothetical protein